MKFILKIITALSVLFFSSYAINENADLSVKAETKVTYKNVNTNKFVNSKGGLILRSTADSKGKKVTMLKDGSKVFVYSTGSNGWSYVKQGKYKGYVKDSYLKASSKNQTTQKKRVIDFTMNVNQVKAMEPAKLSAQYKEGKDTILEYNVTKYGYTALLRYYFINGKLDTILYDFLPDKDSYNSWSEMNVMFDLLDKKAIQEFGNGGYFITDNITHLSRIWEKKGYTVMLRVDDEELFTDVKLAIVKD